MGSLSKVSQNGENGVQNGEKDPIVDRLKGRIEEIKLEKEKIVKMNDLLKEETLAINNLVHSQETEPNKKHMYIKHHRSKESLKKQILKEKKHLYKPKLLALFLPSN